MRVPNCIISASLLCGSKQTSSATESAEGCILPTAFTFNKTAKLKISPIAVPFFLPAVPFAKIKNQATYDKVMVRRRLAIAGMLIALIARCADLVVANNEVIAEQAGDRERQVLGLK